MDTDFVKQTTKERVLNFLRLINLHDETAAQEQFEKWLKWCAEWAKDSGETEIDYELIMTAPLAEWGSAYYSTFKDTETLVSQLAALAARHNLKIEWDEKLQLDWGEDEEIDWNMVSYDKQVFDKITVNDLLVIAGNSLKKQGYTLWFLYTGDSEAQGWMTASRDDASILTLIKLMGWGELYYCTEKTRRLSDSPYFISQ